MKKEEKILNISKILLWLFAIALGILVVAAILTPDDAQEIALPSIVFILSVIVILINIIMLAVFMVLRLIGLFKEKNIKVLKRKLIEVLIVFGILSVIYRLLLKDGDSFLYYFGLALVIEGAGLSSEYREMLKKKVKDSETK